MKKIVLIAAAAGLMSLAACNKPADTSTNNTTTDMAIDNTAGNLDDSANATTTETVTNATDNGTATTTETTNTTTTNAQ